MPKSTAPALSPAQAAQLFKLLGDVPRLHILLLLTERQEMHVAALTNAVGLGQPAVSHHLGLLWMSGLVERRRVGKCNYYSLTSDTVRRLLAFVKF